jgi:hypothetical protein
LHFQIASFVALSARWHGGILAYGDRDFSLRRHKPSARGQAEKEKRRSLHLPWTDKTLEGRRVEILDSQPFQPRQRKKTQYDQKGLLRLRKILYTYRF